MFRYFIYLAYDGTNYHGWQIQPNGSSVQETLMKALHTFLRDEAIEVVGGERKNSLPRRLPKSCYPDYRSERNFEKSPSSG